MNAGFIDRLFALDADEPEWITVNGAHIPLNKEGEPKGKVGEKIRESGEGKSHEARPLASTKPDTARFQELVKAQGGDAKKAAHEYFKEKLQGTHMEARTNEGPIEVHFTGGSWTELKKGMYRDPVKANLVPHLPDIIATGEYAPERPGPQHPDVSVVHTYRKTKDTPEGPKKVVVDVLERKNPEQSQPKNQVYSLNREGSPAWEKRQKKSAPLPDPPGQTGGRRGAPNHDSVAVVDENISPQFEVVNLRIEEAKPMNDKITLDAAPSRRHRDENGFLHVDGCHITREQVAPYYGREIPGWEELGLDPEKLYHAWRPADELEKAAATINGLPILWGHSPESADAPQLDRRIGSMGTDASFNAPYLDNSLIFTVADAIEAIEDGRERELSLSYRYEPDFTPGSFNGEPYDFVMRNLRGNHLALVPEGRAGASCCVADSAPGTAHNPQPLKGGPMSKLKKLFRGANDEDPENKAPEAEAAKAPEENTAPDGGDTGAAMDEDMKAAMDKCGLDADDPALQAAFAEGVKYGEKLERNPEERKKLDREHEAEGMERVDDEEQKPAADEPEAPKAVDEEKVAQTASDAALRKFQSILDAQAEVRPHVGEMRVNLAQDSAATIYGAALDALGIDRKGTPQAAWRGMFRTAVNMQRRGHSAALAQDAAPAKGPLAGLNNISSL